MELNQDAESPGATSPSATKATRAQRPRKGRKLFSLPRKLRYRWNQTACYETLPAELRNMILDFAFSPLEQYETLTIKKEQIRGEQVDVEVCLPDGVKELYVSRQFLQEALPYFASRVKLTTNIPSISTVLNAVRDAPGILQSILPALTRYSPELMVSFDGTTNVGQIFGTLKPFEKLKEVRVVNTQKWYLAITEADYQARIQSPTPLLTNLKKNQSHLCSYMLDQETSNILQETRLPQKLRDAVKHWLKHDKIYQNFRSGTKNFTGKATFHIEAHMRTFRVWNLITVR